MFELISNREMNLKLNCKCGKVLKENRIVLRTHGGELSFQWLGDLRKKQ